MIFNIQLNLLLNLDNGNVALTTIVVDGLNSYDEEKIKEIVSDFKNNFENKNSVTIEKISFLTNKQAESFKEQFETNISYFQKEKTLLILKETIYFLEDYLNEICEQQIKLKLEEKDKSSIISFSILTTNVFFYIQKLEEIVDIFSSNTMPNNKEKIAKQLSTIHSFLSKIHCEDYIVDSLQKIILDLQKK